MALPRPHAQWALFLDFDGSIIELAAAPDRVQVAPELPRLLAELASILDGALAIVSGRPLAQIDGYLAPYKFPAAGLHGIERRGADGCVVMARARDTHLDRIGATLHDFADRHLGVLVEDKGHTIALHYRRAAHLSEQCRQAVVGALDGAGPNLQMLAGKMVLEVKPVGVDKGSAIEAFLAERPFAGRLPVFCGDDVTDEAGFSVVNQKGGISIRVGAAPTTVAHRQAASVDELVAWLATISHTLAPRVRTRRG